MAHQQLRVIRQKITFWPQQKWVPSRYGHLKIGPTSYKESVPLSAFFVRRLKGKSERVGLTKIKTSASLITDERLAETSEDIPVHPYFISDVCLSNCKNAVDRNHYL